VLIENETVVEGWRKAASELDRGAGVGTSGMTSSSYGNLKVEVGDDSISFLEMSTQETDFGMAGTFPLFIEDFVLRRLVDILRHSLPSDNDRVGLKTFFSGPDDPCSTTSILSNGNDNRGLGLGRVASAVGRGIFGELFSDSFDKNGARAFESGCPISLFDLCTPGRT
jgi:hypothetical protein